MRKLQKATLAFLLCLLSAFAVGGLSACDDEGTDGGFQNGVHIKAAAVCLVVIKEGRYRYIRALTKDRKIWGQWLTA